MAKVYKGNITGNIVELSLQDEAGGGGGGGTVQGTDATYDIQAANEGATPGNARGENSVDLQTARSLATHIASGPYATISGGSRNTASGFYSTVGGGYFNRALGFNSTTSGGRENNASNQYSTVSGGTYNTASGSHTTVSGGSNNDALGFYSTVGGGYNNDALGQFSWVGGKNASTGPNDGTFAWADSATGSTTIIPNAANQFAIKAAGGLRLIDGNQAFGYVLTCDADGVGTWQAAGGGGGSGGTIQTPSTLQIRATDEGTVAGDPRGANSVDLQTERNVAIQVASGDHSTIGGGHDNTASGQTSTISGGNGNTASNYFSTVSGGQNNDAIGFNSIVGGGYDNTASGYYSTTSGGISNDAIGEWSTVSGGFDNDAIGTSSTVGGGYQNTAGSGDYSTVSGGRDNTASSASSTVSGGAFNTASGARSTVSGGSSNTANGDDSTVSGGLGNTADGDHSWAGGKYASTGLFDNTFAWNDGGAPGNLDITAITIPNAANQFAIKAAGGLRLIDGNQGANKVLTCDADGVGTWQAAGGGGGGGGTVQNVNLSIEPTDEGTVPGNTRGANSVDLQTNRTLASQVANAPDSIIVGGKNNTNSGDYLGAFGFNTLVGGNSNAITNSTYGNFIGGGGNNTINTQNYFFNTITGGDNNTISSYGHCSVIGGGQGNNTSDRYTTIGGGKGNNATEQYSTISGGYNNTASGNYSAVLGGRNNTADGNYSAVLGGHNNTADGENSVAVGKYADTGGYAGSFAFADSTTSGYSGATPNAADQFAIKAAGGLRLIDGNEAAGYVLTSDANGVGTWQVKDNSRTTATIQATSLADATSTTLDLAVAKSYILHKIETSHAAWVTLYVDDASRVADAGRAETTDPLPGSGVIAEVITSGAETQLITPGTIGWNNDGIPATTAYLKVENQSGATNNIDVTLYYVQLEA